MAPDSDDTNEFEVLTIERAIRLRCDSESDRQSWITVLNMLLKSRYAASKWKRTSSAMAAMAGTLHGSKSGAPPEPAS